MTDLIGWVATLLVIVGSFEIAHKHMRGWWLFLLGNVCWGIVGALSGLYSLITVSVMLIVGDMYGMYQWRKNE